MWLIVALAAVAVIRTVVSGPIFVSGGAAPSSSGGRLNVAVGPAPSAAGSTNPAAADVAIDAEAPSVPADGSMSYTTEQVVERPTAPAPVAAAPPAIGHRDAAAPSERREHGGPRAPTLATDHAAATAMQGLY